MAKRKKTPPELPLFDLPLHPETQPAAAASDESEAEPAEDGGAGAPEMAERPTAAAEQALLFEVESPQESAAGDPAEDRPTPEVPASWGRRLQAGLADLAIHLLMLAVAATAAYRLGVRLTWDYWPPFAGLALIFSFLYWMVPVAFWGQTPGMAWVGQAARGLDDQPLTFYQVFLRWIGALLTTALAGLPLLLALGAGGSLSDRLSASKTVVLQGE